MFKSALRELRFHPGRYIATLLAIAISVGFMATASIVTQTESHAMGTQAVLPYSKADLVVAVNDGPDDLTVDKVESAITSIEGVSAVDTVTTLYMQLDKGEHSQMVSLYTVPEAESLRASTIKEGSFPTGDQIAINSALAKALDLTLGDTVTLSGQSVTVSGITSDPASRLLGNPAYVDQGWPTSQGFQSSPFGAEWIVGLDSDVDQLRAVDATEASLKAIGVTATVRTEEDYAATAATSLTNDIDVFTYILWIFAGIAMVVGLITISNTFAILLAQRRRQIGLLRAIGASGKQVRHSVWAEALLLGLIGDILGFALACGLTAALGLYTGSIHFGLSIPIRETLIAAALGLVITFVACVLPARRATTIPPIEALQPAGNETTVRKGSLARAIICSLFVIAGGVLVVVSKQVGGVSTLLLAIGAAMSISIGVLFGARLFVPGILRVIGAVVKRFGPSASVAAKNVVRDPARASATATALMLAVGLIITLQVGAASVEVSVMTALEKEMPVDLTVVSFSGPDDSTPIPQGVHDRLNSVQGIAESVDIPCKWVVLSESSGDMTRRMCSYIPDIVKVATEYPSTMPDDQVWTGERDTDMPKGTVVALSGTSGTVNLTAKESALAETWSFAFVSPSTYAQLNGTNVDVGLMFLSVDPKADVMTVMRDVTEAAGGDEPQVGLNGFLTQKYMFEMVISILVGAMTVLLAVAVLIALVGVGNTLTLSVIERTRESAILRAVGAQRKQLRTMLLMEALMLVITGAIVGIIAGMFFGWLGASSVIEQFKADGVTMSTQFALNWPQTLGLIGALIVAAGLASILPGRRAAKASPVEALAEV